MHLVGTKAQFNHRSRWLRQQVIRPEIAVVGGYHHGNLGDMALGEATRFQLLKNINESHQIGLQTIYSLEAWPKAKFTVVGGGAILTNNNIQKLIHHVNGDPNRLAIIGTDFLKEDLDAESIKFLSRIPFLAMRSHAERKRAEAMGLNHALSMPDIVFGLPGFPINNRVPSLLGINLVPRFRGDDSASGDSKYAVRYRNFARKIIEYYLQNGSQITHIPFTPQDHDAARKILFGLPVAFSSYKDSPIDVLKAVSRCSTFVSSRFHSLIFCMITSTPVIPFLYAGKCNRLLMDYFEGIHGVSPEDLAASDLTEIMKMANPILFNKSIVASLHQEVSSKFTEMYKAFLNL